MNKDIEVDESMIIASVIIKGVNRRVDKSVTIRLETTTELDSETFKKLDENHLEMGWFVFKPNRADAVESVPKAPATEKHVKTPSQRLRAVLFLYWQSLDKPEADFEVFYRKTMEEVIDHYKQSLPKINY